MRYAVLGFVFAAVMALLAVATVRAPLGRAPEQCSGRIVIVRPPRAEPVECVCTDGVLTSCFSPGP